MSAGVGPGAALAQQPPAAEPVALDKVTVTASKREQRLVDVPSSVQAFDGGEMERAGIKDLQEVIRSVPGAAEGRATQMGTRSFQIRGVSSFYGDSTVGYYLDDAVFTILNRNWAPLGNTFDVSRVEVLRGPQGTLYGTGAMGGIVRFVTEDPNPKAFKLNGGFGQSSTSGGNHNRTVEVAVNVPLSEQAAVRAVVADYHRGGYTDSPSFPGALNTNDSQMFRVKALFKPQPAWTVRVGMSREKYQDPYGNQLSYVPDPAPGSFIGRYAASTVGSQSFRPFNDTTTETSTLYVAYEGDAATIVSSSGYVRAQQSAQVPVNGLQLTTGLDAHTTSSELRAVSKGTGPLNWIVGALYLKADSAETANLTAASPPPVIPVLGPTYSPLRNDVPKFDSRSWAIYGEVSYDMLDGRLTPLFGLRYFHDDRTFTDTQKLHTLLPVGVPGPCGLPFKAETCLVQPSVNQASGMFSSVNPRFNLTYRIDRNTNTYVNIAKGFRSGTFNSASSVQLTGVSAAVSPDKLWSYEWGTKTNRLFGLNMFAEATFYYLTWDDVLLNFNAPGFPPPQPQVISNVGDIRGKGMDLALEWRTSENLTLAATANVNSTKWKTIFSPALFANTHFQVGEQLSTVPKSTFSLSGTYSQWLPWANLTGTAMLAYQYIGQQGDPSTVGSGATTRPAPLGEAQNLVNMRIGVEGLHWSAYLVCTNLGNSNKPWYISGSGYQRPYPRTVGLEARFQY